VLERISHLGFGGKKVWVWLHPGSDPLGCRQLRAFIPSALNLRPPRAPGWNRPRGAAGTPKAGVFGFMGRFRASAERAGAGAARGVCACDPAREH